MLVKARRRCVIANEPRDTHPETYVVCGASYWFDGEDAAQGIESLKSATSLLGSTPRIRFMLATAHMKVGPTADARFLLTRIDNLSRPGVLTNRPKAMLESIDLESIDNVDEAIPEALTAA